MYAVGRLGSYITRSVYTVSGPFHPFGGAVDIIVVEQPDGSFKSSPWYVRFGKFQGVLKTREKVVNITVNGIDANFHMYLDQRGEAYFLREVEGVQGESVSPSSSDETDEKSQNSRRPMKSKSCDFDSDKSNMVDQIDASNGKIVARTSSRQSRILGLVFGQRSMKQDGYLDGGNAPSDGVTRVSSLERAEIAANLLDVKWSTNLATSKPKNDDVLLVSASDISDSKGDSDRLTNDGKSQVGLSVQDAIETGVEHISTEATGSYDVKLHISSHSDFEKQKFSVEEASVEISNLDATRQIIENFISEESALEEKLQEMSDISINTGECCSQNPGQDDNPRGVISEIICPDSQIVDVSEAFPSNNFDEGSFSDERNVALAGFGISKGESGSNRIQSYIYCETAEKSIVDLDGLNEKSEETLLTCGGPEEVHFCPETLQVTTELLSEGTLIQQVEQTEAERVHNQSCYNYLQEMNASSPSVCDNNDVNLEVSLAVSECYTKMASVEPIFHTDVESESISCMPNFSNSVHQIQNQINVGDRITGNEHQPFLESVSGLEQLNGDNNLTEAAGDTVSESSGEEQFLFSDLDDSKHREAQSMSNFTDGVVKENHSSFCPEGSNEVNGPFDTNDESFSSQGSFFQKNQLDPTKKLIGKSKVGSSPFCFPKRQSTTGVEVTRSLPNMRSCINDLRAEDLHHPLSHSLGLDSKPLEWNWHGKYESSFIKSDRNNENQSSLELSHKEDSHRVEDIKSGLANPAVEISLCKHLLYEGMGHEAASQAFDAEKLDIDKLTSVGPEIVKNDRLIIRIGGHYFPWDEAAPIVLGIVAFRSEVIFEPKGKIAVDQVQKSHVGDPSKAIVTSGGNWRLWPFFTRSGYRKTTPPTLSDTRNSDAENISEGDIGTDNDQNVVKPKLSKKVEREITPTSEELASLNLKEGSNVITFTFSTGMLGKQKVEARIYLWKWNTRIVISDVDGTITKSDVLGQFMPLVGMDWSQTGVAPLFSAIKENGYQLLFLSARAISQAYITRQFLVNLKQDGKALPDGPVVISPDGLFPSLFREVIRRAPHEFKIACLEDIKALFPSDCNPFYAGFGNRDTDEFSYLKVGIPKGKIFIINPKGEVAVNRRVDTKSYTSLHALVHGMFPATASSEQEDFNSWNYWKLPPPGIDK